LVKVLVELVDLRLLFQLVLLAEQKLYLLIILFMNLKLQVRLVSTLERDILTFCLYLVVKVVHLTVVVAEAEEVLFIDVI
jgi:hypothetical protein